MIAGKNSFWSFDSGAIFATLLIVSLLVGCGKKKGEEIEESSATDRNAPSAPSEEETNTEGNASNEVIDSDLGTSTSDLGAPRSSSTNLSRSEEVVDNIQQVFNYEDGSKKTECSINIHTLYNPENPLNGHWDFHGPYAEFYQDGAKQCEGAYEEGMRVGEWTFWYSDGTEAKKGRYVEGKPDGEWVVHREDGTLERKESYSLGVIDGQWIEYWENGTSLKSERGFKAGEPDGAWNIWHNAEGQQAIEALYKAGDLEGVRRQWYDNGQLASEEHYQNGERHGRATSWNSTGTKISDEQFEEGKRVDSP